MAATAPISDNPFQNKDKMITGQKEAAIPDHPNMTIQKTVLSGERTAETIAMIRASTAIANVTTRDNLVNRTSDASGRRIF